LVFKIREHNVKGDFSVLWKVLNRGPEARDRDQIRGTIERSNYADNTRKESSDFKGNHSVECYACQNGVIVARDIIAVPII